MKSLYQEAGSRIQNLRMSKGYTREYLAERADISSKFLYEMETGKKGFSADTLYRISKELNVTSDYILTGEGINEKNRRQEYNEKHQIDKLEYLIVKLENILEVKL